MKTSSISQLFEAVQLVIYNLSENPDLQKTMNGYGFTSKRVQEGSALLAHARLMHSTQQTHYDNARQIAVQIHQNRAATLDIFRGHVAIAKSAFRKAPHVIQELKIKRIAGESWAWTPQTIDFYNKAAQYMDVLQQFGATPESFQQNKAAAEALMALKARRLKKKGDAENSTQLKTQSNRKLSAWYGEFRKLARIAFQETPQVLETFGMVIPSSQRRKTPHA